MNKLYTPCNIGVYGFIYDFGDIKLAHSTEQKIKLLVLWDILQKNTDEEKPMTTHNIVTELEQCGISVSRKTLYEDIALLNKYGYEVLCKKGRSNAYYVIDRKFERSEVQVLLSAIGSAKSLSNKKTLVLIQKLYELLGTTEAEQLQSIITVANKRNNERVYYSIDAITTAILEKKKISFLYFDYGISGQRVYRKDKNRYEVNPLGLVFSEDKLYFVCYHDKYENATNYRLDRMDDVKVEHTNTTQNEVFDNFNLAEYKREQFEMFGGVETEIELMIPQDLLEVAIDRFGENIMPVFVGNDMYIVAVTVQISKTFFAWLTTFEGRVMIKSPESVKESYKEFIKKLQ